MSDKIYYEADKNLAVAREKFDASRNKYDEHRKSFRISILMVILALIIGFIIGRIYEKASSSTNQRPMNSEKRLSPRNFILRRFLKYFLLKHPVPELPVQQHSPSESPHKSSSFPQKVFLSQHESHPHHLYLSLLSLLQSHH